MDGEAAAGALWFRNFSTWDGVAGIYLEDLFVRPKFRRRGLARAMLATLARECVESGYTRLSWAVLDWNVDAIALYDAVGGRQQDEWITYRKSGLSCRRWPSRPELSRIVRLLSDRRRTKSTAPPTARTADQRDERDDADRYAVYPLM